MIDINKNYRTRAGHEARVLMTDGGDWNYPVIAAYKNKDGRWWPLHLTADGYHSFNKAIPSDLDLIEVKPRIYFEGWVNVYPGNMLDVAYAEKADADRLAGKTRIACVKLVIDCEEGEGL